MAGVQAIFAQNEINAYWCYIVKGSNANRAYDFTRAYLDLPQFSSNNTTVTKAVSLKTLLKDAFEVLKPNNNGGIRIERTLQISAENNEHQIQALNCLTDFIQDIRIHEQCLARVQEQDDVSEEMVCVALAVHLFSKLVPGGTSDVIINKAVKKKLLTCPCGCRNEFNIGDTGIGSAHVWHGFPGMLVGCTSVCVKTSTSMDSAGDDDVNETDWDYDNQHHCWDIYDNEFSMQAISQCLTNGFAQKSKLGFSNNVVPTVFCTKRQLLIFLYDPDRDILLGRQQHLELFDQDGRLVIEAIAELWLVLNLNIFGSSMSKAVVEKLDKCDFRRFLESEGVLQHYETSGVAIGERELEGINLNHKRSLLITKQAIQYITD